MIEGLQSFFGKEVIFFIDKSLWVTFYVGLQVIHDSSHFGVKELINSSASLLSGVMEGIGDSCFLCKSPFTILYMALKSVLFSVMMFL